MVRRFPNTIQYEGRETLKENYKKYYARTKSSTVTVTNRIVNEAFVIDEEAVLVDGNKSRQSTVYTKYNNLIQSMTFIKNIKTKSDPAAIVDAQLEAYNNRDINAFAATYTEDITLYRYPNTVSSTGNAQLKKDYGPFFQNTPDLHCEIINRMVIGNKVIDQEVVIMNGGKINAVAIYEVEDGKIAKVPFL